MNFTTGSATFDVVKVIGHLERSYSANLPNALYASCRIIFIKIDYIIFT